MFPRPQSVRHWLSGVVAAHRQKAIRVLPVSSSLPVLSEPPTKLETVMTLLASGTPCVRGVVRSRWPRWQAGDASSLGAREIEK